jgi:hypothetical protein
VKLRRALTEELELVRAENLMLRERLYQAIIEKEQAAGEAHELRRTIARLHSPDYTEEWTTP